MALDAMTACSTRHRHLRVDQAMQVAGDAPDSGHSAVMPQIEGFRTQRDDAVDGGMQRVGIELGRHGGREHEAAAVAVELAVGHAKGVTHEAGVRLLVPQRDVVTGVPGRIEHAEEASAQFDAQAVLTGDDPFGCDRHRLAIQLEHALGAIDLGIGAPQPRRINQMAHAARMDQHTSVRAGLHQGPRARSVIEMDMSQDEPIDLRRFDRRFTQGGQHPRHRRSGTRIDDRGTASMDHDMNGGQALPTVACIDRKNPVRVRGYVLHLASSRRRAPMNHAIVYVRARNSPAANLRQTSMLPDFDHIIDRRHVPGDKWGRYAGRDVLPLWVADMDFAAPPEVLAALHARIDHGVFGYAHPWPSLMQAVIDGIARDHDWRIEADWLVWLPGVVTGLNLACRAVAPPGSKVFTATPVYPPFLATPANNDCQLVTVPLEERAGRWEWSRPAAEAALDDATRLFLLCSPHNPTGRVFDEDELNWVVSLAERHDFVICSDEIHCGLALDDSRP